VAAQRSLDRRLTEASRLAAPVTRKGRNLARDPRCALSVAAMEFDLVVEGEATLVTDPATMAVLAAPVKKPNTPSSPVFHDRGRSPG
jgi:hypothetical protein